MDWSTSDPHPSTPPTPQDYLGGVLRGLVGFGGDLWEFGEGGQAEGAGAGAVSGRGRGFTGDGGGGGWGRVRELGQGLGSCFEGRNYAPKMYTLKFCFWLWNKIWPTYFRT